MRTLKLPCLNIFGLESPTRAKILDMPRFFAHFSILLFISGTLVLSPAWAYKYGTTTQATALLSSRDRQSAQTIETLPPNSVVTASDSPKNGFYAVRARSGKTGFFFATQKWSQIQNSLRENYRQAGHCRSSEEKGRFYR